MSNLGTNILDVSRIAITAVIKASPHKAVGLAWRKRISRAEPQMGGLPNLGGLGVLVAEDEPEFTYEKIGDCLVLMTGRYTGGSISDNGSNTVIEGDAQEALIVAAGQGTELTLKKEDVVSIVLSEDIVLAYEIADVPSPFAIQGGGLSKYVLIGKDELSSYAPWE